ncbi:hypothetical protein MRX96_038464 [Rhipicephalus microplus]
MGIPVKSARLRPGVVPSIFDYEQSELHSLRTPLSKGRKNQNNFTAAPEREAAPDLAYESRQAVQTPQEPVCEPGPVADKSVQVRQLTRHKGSQADEKKILSTSVGTSCRNIIRACM